ncbi:Cobalt-zinc-cadmium resistance protein CzcC precursor [Bythopirellula goksoeyrii]|uniref:Cobalt-zinc-cadmium resistance protein CzcC n=2 Tax=Bythopirellula goksoeyrii TaxID=1400387 RepID=A0A5B9QDE3_9BACT|nr:Cobalt-zinc-cadmium resistance protein CzcC precursor [Bythopirellula goksoeyrii]
MRSHAKLVIMSSGVLLAFLPLAVSQELIAPRPAPVPSPTGMQYMAPPRIPATPNEIAFSEAFASQGPVANYGLEELLALAAKNNPTLRQAEAHISAELGKALQAGLYPNPVLSYEAEQIGVDGPNGTSTPGEFQGGVIEQRFVTGGKLRLSREKYLRRARVSENLAMAQQFRVCNDVRIHFYKTLAAGEILSIRREMAKTAEDSAVTAQESYNMGQSNRPQVRRANVALQRARLDVLAVENAYNEAFRTLSTLVGIPLCVGTVEGVLETRCPVISFEEAYGRLLAESPELAAARAKLSVDQVTVARENVQWVPDLVVRGGAGYNFEAEQTTAVAGVVLEVPLYDRNQGTVRQAQADYARQRQEIERVELELRNRLAMIYQQYLTGMQHAREYEQVILPELKAAYRELLESYKERRVDWPDVLMAQHDYFDARLTQVDNLLHARTQEVLVYGYLLHDGLMAAPGISPQGHIESVPKPR